MGLRHFSYILLVTLLFSCAQKSVITGGPKDTEGPKLLFSEPLNEQTNFKGNQLEFRFDEYIQVKNFSSNVLVSPLIENLDYTLKGKKLSVFWTDTLSENTTYSFFFGDAIVDLNESNPIVQKQFVLSTGEVIDSLELSGEIIKSEDNTNEESSFVFLYRSKNDSCIYNDLPDYVTKSSKEGTFQFKYLAAGEYKLFALLDLNSDYKYDEFNERLAFSKGLISVSDSSQEVRLRSFQAIDTTNKIVSKKLAYSELLKVSFKRATELEGIEFLNVSSKKASYFSEWNKTMDSLKLWIPEYRELDSLQLVFKGRSFTDTLTIYPSSKESFKEAKKTWAFSADKEIIDSDSLSIQFAHLILSHNSEDWILEKDSTEQEVVTSYLQEEKTFYLKNLTLGDYELLIPPKNLSNAIGGINPDSIRIKFSVKSRSSYGNCVLSINNLDSLNMVVELIDKKGNKVNEVSFTDSSFNWINTDLKPGKYSFQAYVDVNKNGRWDTGNYLKGIQAEERILFKEEVQIRANWDLELEWNLVQD